MAARDLIFTILGIDKASDKFDNVGDRADSLGEKLDGFGKSSVSGLAKLAVGAVASGAVVAGALAGTALGFGALGVVAASSSTEVVSAYSDMARDVSSEVRQMAEPLAPMLTRVAGDVQETFDKIAPQLEDTIVGAGEHVETLTEGVLGFAEQAMPGFRTSVLSAGPVMQGFKSLLIDTGKGTTDFFTKLSGGSQSAGSILTSLGGIVRDTLGFFGGFFAKMANEGAPSVERVRQVLSQLYGTVQGLGGGAMPVLFGSAGVLLNVLSGLLTVLGPMATQFGGVLGVVISIAAAFKALNAVTSTVQNIGAGLTGYMEKVKAAGGETGGFSGKVRGLTGLLGGPLGFAAIGAGLLLTALGDSQQEAAKAAQEHQQRVDSLARALRESGGAINANVRALAAADLQNTQVGQSGKNVLQVARDLSLQLPQLTDGYLGSTAAQESLARQLDAIIAKGTTYVDTESSKQAVMDASADKAYLLKQQLGLTNGTMGEAVQKNKDLAAASKSSSEASQEHAQALVAERLELLASVDKSFAYEQSLRGIESAQKNVTETAKQHKAGTLESREALGQLNQAVRTAIVSAGDYAVATSGATTEAEKNKVSLDAQNAEALRLASTWSGPLPAALTRSIGTMDATSLAALGVTRTVDGAGNAVLRLPNGKEVHISATDGVSGVVDRIKAAINSIRNTTINFGANVAGWFGGGRAEGGPVKAGTMYKVGERGWEYMIPTADGTIIPHDQSRQIEASTRAGSSMPYAFAAPSTRAAGATSTTDDVRQLAAAIGAATAAALAPLLPGLLDGARLEIGGDGLGRLVRLNTLSNDRR